MEYVNQLAPGPLGGSDADQKLAAKWVDKLDKWDGNLFIAANGDPGGAGVGARHCLYHSAWPQPWFRNWERPAVTASLRLHAVRVV